MKRLIVLLVSVMVFLSIMTGCGEPQEEQPEEQIDYEIAMVTDSGMIMDGGYSEVAWTAISEFGAAEGISHKYYKAAEASESAYKGAIDDAVEKGAKVIIADGYSFEDVVYNAQTEYKDVKFILIDAEPVDQESGETKIGDNTTAILFASEEAGYLAGYSAVKDGKTQLGFIGQIRKPDIMDYGYGFVQGAEAAAREMGTEVSVRYKYCTDDESRDDILAAANQWYQAGTEVIFACGSQVEQPVIESAELYEKEVIAFETEKSGMSDRIMTSAVKDIGGALEQALKEYEEDEFKGGEVTEYSTANDGIWLDMENSRFSSFSEDEYSDVLKSLSDGSITVKRYDSGDISSLGLNRVTVLQ